MSKEQNHHHDILQGANSSGTSHWLTLLRLDWPAKTTAFTDDQIISGREIVCFAEALFSTWLEGFNSQKVSDDLLQLSPYYGSTEWGRSLQPFYPDRRHREASQVATSGSGHSQRRLSQALMVRAERSKSADNPTTYLESGELKPANRWDKLVRCRSDSRQECNQGTAAA